MYTRGKFKFVDPIALLFKFRKIAGETKIKSSPELHFFNCMYEWRF